MYFVDIDKNTARITSDEGINHNIEVESFYNYVEDNKDVNFYVCTNNTKVSHCLSEKYINVKIFDSKEYDKIFENINDNILKLPPQRVLRAYSAFKDIAADVIIVNIEDVLTVDVFNAGEYGTGSIFPAFESLFLSLKDLEYPVQKFNNIDQPIIQDIPNQIGKGVVNGYIGALKNILETHQCEYPWINHIVFTGSNMRSFIQYYGHDRLIQELNTDFIYIDDLLSKGIRYFYELNEK